MIELNATPLPFAQVVYSYGELLSSVFWLLPVHDRSQQ